MGFTLIELVVDISIVGIMARAVLSKMMDIQKKFR